MSHANTHTEGASLRLQIRSSIESIIAILGQIPTDGAALMLRIFVQDRPRDLSHHKFSWPSGNCQAPMQDFASLRLCLRRNSSEESYSEAGVYLYWHDI